MISTKFLIRQKTNVWRLKTESSTTERIISYPSTVLVCVWLFVPGISLNLHTNPGCVVLRKNITSAEFRKQSYVFVYILVNINLVMFSSKINNVVCEANSLKLCCKKTPGRLVDIARPRQIRVAMQRV